MSQLKSHVKYLCWNQPPLHIFAMEAILYKISFPINTFQLVIVHFLKNRILVFLLDTLSEIFVSNRSCSINDNILASSRLTIAVTIFSLKL